MRSLSLTTLYILINSTEYQFLLVISCDQLDEISSNAFLLDNLL